MIKAIVFDFDGLTVDTEYALYESFCDILEMKPGNLPINEYAFHIGTDSSSLYNFILSQANGLLTRDEIIEKSAVLHKAKLNKPIARDGIEDYLKAAKAQGLKIGLASSSYREWVEHFLIKLNILHYFDIIQTRDDVKKVKPDPELYENVVKLLGVNPREAIAFEDSANGSKAALSAGLNCVIVPNKITEHLPFENYHLKLASMADKSLEEVIDSIEKTVKLLEK